MSLARNSTRVFPRPGSVPVDWPLVLGSAGCDIIYNTALAWGLALGLKCGFCLRLGVCVCVTGNVPTQGTESAN